MSRIDIMLGNQAVGSVAFPAPQTALTAIRTASGFRVWIPAVVTFSPPSGSGSPLLLENLRATFYQHDAGKGLEIGVASYSPILRTPVREMPITFSWDWTLAMFAFYERHREGQEPKFGLMVSGDIRYVLLSEGAHATGKEPCSIPTAFHQWCEVSYSQEVWTKMMRETNLRDSILLEIPFPSDPPGGWEPVWSGLRDARDSFDTGGSTGWKNCITGARLALEEWRKIEPEDKGPADPQSRTKLQRIDNLRWHLIQLAHYAAHTKADEWTRDDALLALSGLCALLSVRKP